MDDGFWRTKCAPAWQPAPPPQSMTQSLPPLPPAAPPPPPLPPPAAATVPAPVSAGQVEKYLHNHFRSFIAQEAHLKDQNRVRESLAFRTLNTGSYELGKMVPGNSFLSLLSGDSRIAKLPANTDVSVLNGMSCGVPVTQIPPPPEKHGNDVLKNWNELSSFVDFKQFDNSTYIKSPRLLNNRAAGPCHDTGSVNSASQQASKNNNTSFAVSVTTNGWPTSVRPAISSRNHNLNVQATRKVPCNGKSSSSCNTSPLPRGRPRVFCRNTVGELFMSDMGLFGVICLCHSSHMSLAKFCEHSGLPSTNPGEAVHLESGMTISEWCKQCLGTVAPGDSNRWEWSEGSSVNCAFVEPKAINFPPFLDNIGTTANFVAFGESQRSVETLNNSLRSSYPVDVGNCSIQEKSGKLNKEQDNADQRYNLDTNIRFREMLPGQTKVTMSALTKRQTIQAVQQSPCIPGKACSTLHKEKDVLDHEMSIRDANYKGNSADGNILHPYSWVKSVNHGHDVNTSRFSVEAAQVDKHGAASSIELSLGQPSHIFAGSVSPSMLQFGASREKKQIFRHLQQGSNTDVTNARNTKKTRLNSNLTPSDASCSNRSNVQQADGTAKLVNHTKQEQTYDTTKNSLISLFLSHLEGNNTSHSLDNIFTNNEWYQSRVVNDDSLFVKFNQSDSLRYTTDNFEGKSSPSRSDPSRNFDGQILKPADDGKVVYNNQAADTRKPDSSISRKCSKFTSFVDYSQSSSCLNQLSGSPQEPYARSANQSGKASFIPNRNFSDYVIHESSNQVPLVTTIPGSTSPDIPMDLSSGKLSFSKPSFLCPASDTKKPFMDEKLKGFTSSHTVNCSREEEDTASVKPCPENQRLCFLSSRECQADACEDTSAVVPNVLCKGHCCSTHLEISKLALGSVYPRPSCQSACAVDTLVNHPGHSGPKRLCNCTGLIQRAPLHSEHHNENFSTCCTCGADERPCLRLATLSNNCVADGCKHEICNYKEKISYLPGKCCFSLLPSCVSGCRILGADSTYSALNEQRLCGQAKVVRVNPDYMDCLLPDCKRMRLAWTFGGNDNLMALNEENACVQAKAPHVGPAHEKDSLLQDCRTIRSAQCDCLKNNGVLSNDYQTTFWRAVPEKIFAYPDTALTDNIVQTLETMKIFDDQQTVAAASKELEGSHQVSKLMRPEQISNVSSGSSAPVITEVSVEGNNICSQTLNYRPLNVTHNVAVDEGSGIEKCGSSDEALGSRGCDDALTSIGKVDPPKHFSQSDSSGCFINDHFSKSQSKVKRSKNQNNGECTTEAHINRRQDFVRLAKAGDNKELIEWNRSSALSDLPMFHSDLPDAVDYSNVNQSSAEGDEISRHEDDEMQRSKLSSGSSSLKRKRSGMSSGKSNFLDRLKIQDKVLEINQEQWSDDEFSIRRSEVSAGKKTKKPQKYMSLNYIVNSPNGGKVNSSKIGRPVVCGNSGILSNGGINDQEKPAKFVSLSSILRKAKMCMPPEVHKPESTGFSDSKDPQLSTKRRDCNKLFPELSPGNEEPNHILGNESNTAILRNSLEVRKCSNRNDDADSRSSIGEEKGSRSNRSLEHGSNCLISQAGPRYEAAHKYSLDMHAGKDIDDTSLEVFQDPIHGGTTSLPAAGVDIFSDLNESEPEHQGSKLFASEFLEGASATITRSVTNYKNIQNHAGKLSQTSRRSKGQKQSFLLDPGAFCCVCGNSNREDSNQLVECNGCLIRVHQACYGIPKVPKGHWLCRPCKINSKNIVCVLCGYGGGAMTRALKSQNIIKSLLKAWKLDIRSNSVKSGVSSEPRDDELLRSSSLGEASKSENSNLALVSLGAAVKMDVQDQGFAVEKNGGLRNFQDQNSIIAGIFDPSITQWVHMVCGLWTPGTRCPNVDTMSAFDVAGASPAKKNTVCSMCNRTGGSCIICRVPNCTVGFHPWCAHQMGLLQSEIEGNDSDKVGFYGRCLYHATVDGFNVESHVMDLEAVNPSDKDSTCARTQGFKGRKGEDGLRLNPQKPCKDSGGCIVSHEQINAWLHINGQRLITRWIVKPLCSDIEYDFRKEYIRYKQSKGWKHLVVYKSGIHALGLYTSQFIARGAMVVEYVGEIVGLRVADKREIEYQSGSRTQYKSACYFFRIDKEHIIDATRKGGIARFVNHSCLPNCVAKVISVRNEKKVVFFAERDINPGEEITYDYHFNSEDEGKKIPCFCNSKNCRRYLN